ncbi:T9SS type A sorting domain-containing protein, partial [candidate division TA06 bacterium]|nr:T9SS type A sorting domain-containing protein [candidate division TA06 bacterium]
PFHPTTTIRYILAGVRGQGLGISGEEKLPVSLTIYNISGRLVETLVNERQEPGVYQVQWEGKDQASGIYFYRLTARGLDELNPYIATKKLILLQ